MVSSLLLRSASVGGVFMGGMVGGALAQTQQTYQLDVSYSGASFFEGWDFFNGPDPTVGFVTYNDATTAADKDLISVDSSGTAFINVDSKNTISPTGPGRDSVRISTKKQFTHGLIIADITNMPGGVCGTWPAFWSFGPNWPTSGEIDIIEGVNSQSKNLMSLHVAGECTIAGDLQTGTLETANCDQSAGFGSGCGVLETTTTSYGTGFNANNGGVYATQWTSDFIRIWFFPSGSVPADITNGTPDPSTWGTPTTNFQGSCNIDDHFKNHNIIFDTTFCGQWGGAVWASDPVCGGLAPTCNEYVANNPGAFADMYWAIRSVKVYQLGDAPAPPPSPPSTPEPTPTPTPEPSTTSSLSSSTEIVNTSTDVTASSLSTEVPSPSESTIIPIATPTIPPTVKQVVGAYTFHACLTESAEDAVGIRTLASKTTAYDTMTLESCAADCVDFRYFGTEYGRECYCADSFSPGAVPAADGDCNMICAGDGSEFCGGSNRVSIYELTADIGLSSTSTSATDLPTPISDALGGTTTSEVSTSSTLTSESLTTDIPTSTSSTESSTMESTSTSGGLFVQLPSSTSASSTSESSTSSVSSTSEPLSSPTETTSPNPAKIGAFDYLGCYASPSTSFTQIYSGPDNTPELCVSKCSTSAYAGIFGPECYCSDTFDSTVIQSAGSCDVPCPGDSSLVCGGMVKVPRRELGQGVFLTVYECPANLPSVQSSSSSSSSSSASPSTSTSSVESSLTSSTSSTLSTSSAIESQNSTGTTSVPVFKPTLTPSSLPIQAQTTSYSISTVYSTKIHTITSCAAGITNCPAHVTTEIISLYTTLCPITAESTPTPTSTAEALPTSYPEAQSTVSTVYTTTVYTMTSCEASVTDCPAKIGKVTTEIVPLYTTICPITATHIPTTQSGIPTYPSLTSQVPQGSVLGYGKGGSATVPYQTYPQATTTAIYNSGSSTPEGESNGNGNGKGDGGISSVTVIPVSTPLPPSPSYPIYPVGGVNGNGNATYIASGVARPTGMVMPSYSGIPTSGAEKVRSWGVRLAGMVGIVGAWYFL